MLELFAGQILEAIYFALFMIFTKRLKNKCILFTILMIAEYILLKQFLHYTMWFQVLYTFITFLILKVLYKQQAQITDIFTFMIGSFILMLISGVPYVIIYFTIQNFYVYVGDFVERCNEGIYLITMPNHITTAIDGVIYDTFDCRNRTLWSVWKVE